MSSVYDLTAAARIRGAAIRVFAHRGVDGATIREIAQGAGVSPALVIHHYGSKAGLRDACDRHVLETSAREKMGLLQAGRAPDQADYLREHPEVAEQLSYLARAVHEGGESAERWFDKLVTHTDDMLAEVDRRGGLVTSSDPRARSVVLVAQSLATLVFADQIARHLGSEASGDPDGLSRFGRAVLELHTTGLFRDDVMPGDVGGSDDE